METLVGMVTFGNPKYTRMALDGLFKSKNTEFDVIVIIGKPNDLETKNLLVNYPINQIIEHKENMGFPYSINQIFDYGNYNNYVIQGNDVVPHELALSKLVQYSKEYDWVNSREVSVGALRNKKPELFGENKKLIPDYINVWEYLEYKDTNDLVSMNNFRKIGDSFNLCLFTRELIDKIGYVDENFFPNGYFSDNDYGKRAQLSGAKMVQVLGARYFHFWSRTIWEAGMKKSNDFYFPKNKDYYVKKWGGIPGEERKQGEIYRGEYKKEVVEHWRGLRK